MNDEQLTALWAALQPAADQCRRIDARVFTWLEAHDTLLAAEWLGLFKAAPFSATGLVAVSAAAVAATTPFLWLARALL